MQLPRIFVKDDAQAAEAAGGAAEAAGARPAKPVAARLELEGEKRLPEGASWRWGEPGDEACRMGGTGWYRQVTITEKEGGVSLRHMHHCMSMNALEQGLLGLEAAKASDIDDFV